MIGTVLEQTRQLLGRGFLIAGLVPTLAFAAVLSYLLTGGAALATIRAWARSGAGAIVDVILVAATVYIGGFVIYSARSVLHRLYQGQLLPWPLFLARCRLRRLLRRRAEKEAALDDPAWAIDFKFEPTYSPVVITPEDGRSRIGGLRAAHDEILRACREGRAWTDDAYLEILRSARALQANRTRFPEDLRGDVDALVSAIKSAWDANAPLQAATRRLNSIALREWTEAYSAVSDETPEDERWLRPTRLGNLVSVQETYPLDRYGINLSSLWPRMMHVMPEAARSRIEEAGIFLDFTILMSFFSLISAVVASVMAARGPAPVTMADPPGGAPSTSTLWLLAAILLAGAVMAYWLALGASRALGRETRAAVDLFRLPLLDSLRIKMPATPEKEREIWTDLRLFFTQGDLPTRVRFNVKEEPAPAPPTRPCGRLTGYLAALATRFWPGRQPGT